MRLRYDLESFISAIDAYFFAGFSFFFRHIYFHWSCSLSFVAEEFFSKRVMILYFIKNCPKFHKSENLFSQCMIISFHFQVKFFAKLTILKNRLR